MAKYIVYTADDAVVLLHGQDVIRDATRLSSRNERLQASRKWDGRMFCSLAAEANGN